MGKSVDVNLKQFYTNVLKNNPLLYDHQFIVTFSGADLPASLVSDPSNFTSLTYFVKSATIPKIEIMEHTVNFLSQDFVVPGSLQNTAGTWDCKLMATNSLQHYVSLRNWHKQFADLARNGGGQHTIPNVTAHVHVLDSTMQEELHDFVLEGVFPSKLADISMKYENAANIPELTCTFQYQYMYKSSEGDPLGA